jgi:hypothetical protein
MRGHELNAAIMGMLPAIDTVITAHVHTPGRHHDLRRMLFGRDLRPLHLPGTPTSHRRSRPGPRLLETTTPADITATRSRRPTGK